MVADKTKVTVKTASSGTSAKTKKAAKPAVKPTAKKVETEPGSTVKKTKKVPKDKTVHDSFSMPKTEHLKIAEIKETCLKAGFHIRKSEILRAGLKVLGEMSQSRLEATLAELGKVKAAHPKKP